MNKLLLLMLVCVFGLDAGELTKLAFEQVYRFRASSRTERKKDSAMFSLCPAV